MMPNGGETGRGEGRPGRGHRGKMKEEDGTVYVRVTECVRKESKMKLC